MKFKEQDIVILLKDYSAHGVPKGSEGWVIETLDNPGEGYLVEFFDSDNYPTEVLALPPDEIELRAKVQEPSVANM